MLTCSVVPGRRSSKVPVVPRERSSTSRPRAAAASQCAVTSSRCFPREHDQRIQGEWPRAARTGQQCRRIWPGDGRMPQGLLLENVTRGARKQSRPGAQALGRVRSPVGPKNPIPGCRRLIERSRNAQAARGWTTRPETQPTGRRRKRWRHVGQQARHFGGAARRPPARATRFGEGLSERGQLIHAQTSAGEPCR